ncbi:diguanylate cyclase [Arcobacter sp. FWKO B]|uniref:sensor domain-containing diguanylate cyclase n=1 Tax=Arcobacter sp. FWKO B TaxID=2593672 RepID=UPI0018A340E4|nr:diguanylate cyclase [Arcobacter sp. FWKO B]QOG12733.1 diguanylate cyclase [Arcobacter sp. FWKO B]
MTFNVKNKTLIFIVIIFILNIIFFGYIFYKNLQNELLEIKEINFNKIKTSFEKNIQVHYVDFYTKKTQDILTNDMINAIQNKDKDVLLKLALPIFDMLKKEKLLNQMHFHLEDGTSLLRVHNPSSYGDDIASLRPLIKRVHDTNKIAFGFEDGISGLSYRVVVPVFKDSAYIGAIEFGSSPEGILHLVTIFNEISGILYFDNLHLSSKEQNKIQYMRIHDRFYYTLLNNMTNLVDYQYINKNNRLIAIYSFDIQNYSKQKVGHFVFFNDLTKYQTKFEETIVDFFIISLVSFIVIFLIINFGFNIIINKLQLSYDTIKRYTKLIDENVITSSTDLKGNITYTSEAFAKISGYSQGELVSKNHRIIRHPDMPKELYENMWKTIKNNNTWQGEIKNRKKDGGFYWVKATISPSFDENNKKIGYTAIRQDITDKKIIEEISITDGLTNVYNRRHFNEIFPKVINSANRKDELVCFLLLDIDHFKQYNDNYGHQAGDDVLIEFAKCLKENLKRADDMVFRLGGEEFGVLFKSETKEKAIEFANNLKEKIVELKIVHEYSSASPYITASMGLVCKYGDEIKDMDEVYKDADDLLYKSKQNGRNQVSING